LTQPISTRKSAEYLGLGILLLFVACRTFFFSAALPFYNNVDEFSHVDTVLKFASGNWPTNPQERFSLNAVRLMVPHVSWEYMNKPENVRVKEPIWTLPSEVSAEAIEKSAEYWSTQLEPEALSPPLYYFSAGIWYRICVALGFSDGRALYCIRFLNVPIAVATILAVCFFAKTVFPLSPEKRLAIVLLAAFIPQNVKYTVNSDVLSPLLVTLALAMALQWFAQSRPSALLSAGAGLVAASTILVKFSNAPVLAALAIIVAAKSYQMIRLKEPVLRFVPQLTLLACVTLPIAAYCGRNYYYFGEWTATRSKTSWLGWTPKTFSSWFDHPIFTPVGMYTYWTDLVARFWGGELTWHAVPLSNRPLTVFYVVTTTAFLVSSLAYFIMPSKIRTKFNPSLTTIAFSTSAATVVLSVLLLVWLSISYNFERGTYPSTSYPYFTSGRLIYGMLAPFCALYVEGLYFLLKKYADEKYGLRLIFIACALMQFSEMMLFLPVFQSNFNWFHLP
jgi:hypothetical protein